MTVEKVNAVREHRSTSRAYEFDTDEEQKYLDHEVAFFQAKGQGIQG